MIKELWFCSTCDKEVDVRHHVIQPKHSVGYRWSYTTDPYTQTHSAIQRLLKEYESHPRLIVALDFDDTVFDFHQQGFTYPMVLHTLQRASKAGFYLMLFTACAPESFEDQKSYLAEQGILVHSVNENPIDLPFGKHGKPYYNILLDDRAGLGQALETLNAVLTRIEEVKV